MVWVQGSDALIDQGTAVGARGHDDVFASRGFCQLEAKGSHAQHSPDGPAQHSISSWLQKRHTAMLNHTDEQLKHKGKGVPRWILAYQGVLYSCWAVHLNSGT